MDAKVSGRVDYGACHIHFAVCFTDMARQQSCHRGELERDVLTEEMA